MAFDVYELYNSRRVSLSFDSQSATLEYFGKYTFDEGDALDGFMAVVPEIFNGLTFEHIELTPLGGGCWTASVSYKPISTSQVDGQGGETTPDTPTVPGATDPLGPEYSFDISTVTETVTQSKATISKTKRGGGVAADNKQAIGVTADGEVKGCERLSPHLEWSTTRTLGFITLQYLSALYAIVGRTNDASFYGFPAGSVLLVGVSGQSKDTAKYGVTYKFAVRPNEVNITICDGLVVPAKQGWHYLWVSYKNVDDANKLFMQPEAAYVERIYDSADYAGLGLGG